MKYEEYFYQCSPDYISSIEFGLREEILGIIEKLPKRAMQTQVNQDFIWLLGNKQWSFDPFANDFPDVPPQDLNLKDSTKEFLKKNNKRQLCRTSQTLNAGWMADFAKQYRINRVCIEVQFGKVEAMFKDFCGFRISRYEKNIALGIEIVMLDPTEYFKDRKQSVSGMAYFRIAKETLPTIDLDCPIWLVGIQ